MNGLLNELPKYSLWPHQLPKCSLWPHRLLGLEPWETRKKVAAELMREYEDEKWGPLWERVRSAGGRITVDVVTEWLFKGQPDVLCWDGGALVKSTLLDASSRQYELIRNALTELLPASALVELGAGYGQIILNLAADEQIAAPSLMAAEYTASGVHLLRYLAESQMTGITAGFCDFAEPGITQMVFPEKALYFTANATLCIPQYDIGFVKKIIEWNPKTVVHFEPFYEHCNDSTLLGALQKRYIEVNDYNRNLLGVIKDAAARGLIEIVEEQPQVFGINPFLPFSIVAWRPCR
jgi:hypothetical protein